MPAATVLRISFGCGAAPTFFWGGHAARAQASVGPLLDPNGCLARSVMRTQPSTEEPGAVPTQQLEAMTEKKLAAHAAKKNLLGILTTGRLMGVTEILELSANSISGLFHIDGETSRRDIEARLGKLVRARHVASRWPANDQ